MPITLAKNLAYSLHKAPDLYNTSCKQSNLLLYAIQQWAPCREQ